MAQSASSATTLPAPQLRQLEDQITELAAHIHAADYRFLSLIREFDAADGWVGPGRRSCAHWAGPNHYRGFRRLTAFAPRTAALPMRVLDFSILT